MDIRQFRHSENTRLKEFNTTVNFRFFNVIKNRFDYSVNIFYVIYMIIRLEPDLVCLKGILRALLCTSHERYYGWIMCALKLEGTIYLCKFDTEIKRKFTPFTDPDISKCVNQNEEFSCIFKSKFKHHVILDLHSLLSIGSTKRGRSLCIAFLEKIKEIVWEEQDKCLYKFTYDPKRNTVAVFKQNPNKSEYTFLHSWYIENINSSVFQGKKLNNY
uniref:uncharacterized protein LOC117155447 n=1 Tax=Bombus vancouverensis nearcticus TaxID=2705178 RepID=UPI00143B748F|nr:uncharacterized protein LOC117155447 [Bombus vancouverensis nearcticus]